MIDPSSAVRPTHRAVCAAALIGAAMMLASCSGSGSTVTSSNGGASTTTATASTYATIADLDKALIAKNIPCALEYAGLKDDVSKVELSICTIDGEQAYLRVWEDPKMLQQFVASAEGATGTVAVGANWTITVVSNATAAKIGKAIGGTAPGGTTSSTVTR